MAEVIASTVLCSLGPHHGLLSGLCRASRSIQNGVYHTQVAICLQRDAVGLFNGTATFQRLMEQIFEPLVVDRVLVYLDDVLIFAATVEGLFETLELVLRLLKNANLKCKA